MIKDNFNHNNYKEESHYDVFRKNYRVQIMLFFYKSKRYGFNITCGTTLTFELL